MRHLHGRMLAGLLALLLAGCGDDATAPRDTVPEGGGIITLAFDDGAVTTMRVAAGAAALEAATLYIETQSGPRMPFGLIEHGAGVDERYPLHFVAESVELVGFAMELCDGAPMTTREEVDAFMRGATGETRPTSATWCPWSARPIAVEWQRDGAPAMQR